LVVFSWHTKDVETFDDEFEKVCLDRWSKYINQDSEVLLKGIRRDKNELHKESEKKNVEISKLQKDKDELKEKFTKKDD